MEKFKLRQFVQPNSQDLKNVPKNYKTMVEKFMYIPNDTQNFTFCGLQLFRNK